MKKFVMLLKKVLFPNFKKKNNETYKILYCILSSCFYAACGIGANSRFFPAHRLANDGRRDDRCAVVR
jgi:hypothetical protein